MTLGAARREMRALSEKIVTESEVRLIIKSHTDRVFWRLLAWSIGAAVVSSASIWLVLR